MGTKPSYVGLYSSRTPRNDNKPNLAGIGINRSLCAATPRIEKKESHLTSVFRELDSCSRI
jgi:hypothetical protein